MDTSTIGNNAKNSKNSIVFIEDVRKKLAKEQIKRNLSEYKNICVAGRYVGIKSYGAPVQYNFSGQPIAYEKKEIKHSD